MSRIFAVVVVAVGMSSLEYWLITHMFQSPKQGMITLLISYGVTRAMRVYGEISEG